MLNRMLPVIVALLCREAAPGLAQLPSIMVPECTQPSVLDSDDDGLDDACELTLARQFAPTLLVRSHGCDWDDSVQPASLGGGYMYAVQAVGDAIRIAYLPAYYLDCGWRGAKCLLPWIDCAPHDGDSEIIIVEVASAGEHLWQVSGIFLSAHCFGRAPRDCRWYRGRELETFEWRESSALIWVADGRHANYPTWSACERGHFYVDTCGRHDVGYRFPVTADRNIGSRAAPVGGDGCIGGSDLQSNRVELQARECFWDPHRSFGGWQSRGRGVTPYERYLREVAQF